VLGIELKVTLELPPAPTVVVAIDSYEVEDNKAPQPNPLTDPIDSSIGLTRTPYANFV
jgi:hypothetical protein